MATCKHCGKKGKVLGTGWCEECTAESIAASREKWKDRDLAKDFSEANEKVSVSADAQSNMLPIVLRTDPQEHVLTIAQSASQDDNIARCPKCGSTSLSGDKKGFGIGKAVVGAALTGGIGLAAGNIGAKKVRVTCLKCGHQFWAGKG